MSAGDHGAVGAFALKDLALALAIRRLRDVSLDRRSGGRSRTGLRGPSSRAVPAGASTAARPARSRSPHPGPAPSVTLAAPARTADAPARTTAAPARRAPTATRAPRSVATSAALPLEARPAGGHAGPGTSGPTRRRTRPAGRPGGVEGHTGEVWWAAAPTPEALLLAVDAKLAGLGRPAPAPRTPPGRSGPVTSGPARVAVVGPDRERLERARSAVAAGTPYADDDVAFTARGFVATEGKIALLLPHTPDTGADAWAALLRPLARWAGLDGPIGEVGSASVMDVVFHRLGVPVDVVAHRVADGLWATATDGACTFASLARRLHDNGTRVFVEAGTGRLAGALAAVLGDRPHARVASLSPDRPPLAQADRVLSRLWVEGCDVAPDALHQPLPHVRGSAATHREKDSAPAVRLGLRAIEGRNG